MVPHKIVIATPQLSQCAIFGTVALCCAVYRHEQVAGSAVCGMVSRIHISAAAEFLNVILSGY